MLVSLLLVAIGLLASQGLCQQGGSTSCLGSPQPLISGSMYRVEDDQFSADSSFDGDYLPHDARITSESWCSSNTGGPYWIEVDFERDVIIHELQIGGHDGFLFANSYLRMFQVEYGPDDDQLTPILQDDTPRVFSRPSEHSVQTTLLPSPIVTRVLRIIPVDWSQSVPCVRLEALGCIYVPDHSTTTTPPITPTTLQHLSITATPTSSTRLVLPMPTQTTPGMVTPTQTIPGLATPTQTIPTDVIDIGPIIEPAVGGAVGGVILVILMFILFLVICLVTKKTKTTRVTPPVLEDDNKESPEIYSYVTTDKVRAVKQKGMEDDGSIVENVAYGSSLRDGQTAGVMEQNVAYGSLVGQSHNMDTFGALEIIEGLHTEDNIAYFSVHK